MVTIRVVRTFIFAYVFEGEGEIGIFAFDDTDFAESTAPNNA